jgi:hypothetical protein
LGQKVRADVAQLVEHSLGKGEVTSSILVIGSIRLGTICMSTYQQAGIPVEKVAEFEELKAGIARVFSPAVIERYFSKLESKGIRIRQFEKILDKRLLEQFDPQLKKHGARKLYDALTVGDQALMRELYLRTLEQVDDAVRTKFYKIYVMY